jgi:hypothetical protein
MGQQLYGRAAVRQEGNPKASGESAAVPKVRKESGLLGFSNSPMLLKGQSFQAFHLVGKVRFRARKNDSSEPSPIEAK